MAASSKKKAPAAKPVARRFKVAIPERMTVAFDTMKVTWFNETTNAELRGWKGSEHELVARLPHGHGLARQSRARSKGRGQRQGNRRRPGNHRTADRRAGAHRTKADENVRGVAQRRRSSNGATNPTSSPELRPARNECPREPRQVEAGGRGRALRASSYSRRAEKCPYAKRNSGRDG